MIASVYAVFKRIRIFHYSFYGFHSFRCCLHFRIIRITAIRVFWQTDEVAEVKRR